MCVLQKYCFGWYPDLPDHRDITPADEEVRGLCRLLESRKAKAAEKRHPQRVDWRDYCPSVADQGELATDTAHAAVALVQYFERRASGQLIKPSRLFVHFVARRIVNGGAGASLRAALKGIARFGIPPEAYWAYDPQQLDLHPDAFAYGFDDDYRGLRYVRLDSRILTGDQILRNLKVFLAAGFPSAFGFVVHDSISDEPCIPFPTVFDAALAGHAVTAVGYDDNLRVRSEKGALLIQNSWGKSWGEGGFGWLPYRYVTDKVASDFWTLLRPTWLASGEFFRPF